MEIEIPGYRTLHLNTLLLDYNGTIAVDGHIRPGVRERLKELGDKLEIIILTADTHGTAKEECEGLPVTVRTFPVGNAAGHKAQAAEEKGGSCCAALGNGRNDREMFQRAGLSVAVMDREGAYGRLLHEADLVVSSAEDGLDLFLHPKRLIAGLRG